MANDNQSDPRKNFAPRFLPWLLAAGAFAVYWLTLNRWVSLFNVGAVAKISGFTWQPEVLNPVFLAVTYPFRWLPSAQIPIALNLFSAVCGALTLGLLARSVAILPHDRTDVQRKRERSDFSFLTIRNAWLPPILAVAVCGLQLTFWEQATNCTGEIFDLLLFAFGIWSLLEYRLDEREGRLFLAAFVYGAGMAENWAMVGFFPIFIAAIIWARKLVFFNARFLGQMSLCGLAGMLFYLLLPLLVATSDKVPLTFWQALKANLSGQYFWIKIFFLRDDFRHTVALMALTSLLPVLFISLRWKSSFGDRSYLGSITASLMFHLIHGIFLLICVWVAFDPPFSPRHLGYGLSFLTFYYLGALSAGYFAGYFLLVFRPEIASRRSGKSKSKSSPFELLDKPANAGVCLVLILAAAGLVSRNAPQIRDTNGDTFQKYAALVDENLPRNGGILLCDDSRRQFITQAALAKEGRAKDFITLDTHSLSYPAYHKFLHAQFPKKWPDTVTAAEMTNGVSPLHLIGLLATLAKTNDLYYLHPSFGYYFEEFYLEPHGMVYKMKTLPADTLLPPLPDKNLTDENEAFWSHAKTEVFAPIERAAAPEDPGAPQSLAEKIFARLHIEREPNVNAITAGAFYSRGLDFWAVELQRAGNLEKAAAHFETAQKLNPDNVIAQINLQFNQQLRARQTVSVDLSTVTPDRFGKYRDWNAVMNENGPFDEPSYDFELGLLYANRNEMFRQAVAPLARVRELAPDYLPARLQLAASYLVSRLPDRALDALRAPLEQPEKFSLGETNETQLDLFAAAAYFQKNDTVTGIRLIETELSRHPTNDDLFVTAAQAYLAHGLFPNALSVINRKLEYAPDDPTWLFSKGYVSIQVKDYNTAISTLTRVLAIQTNNPQALFNRAIAYLQSDRLAEASADYTTLRQTYTNSVQVAYGLGEIAWRRHDTNEAIRNYETYLANAKTNTAEATNIIGRLKSLKR
jgi:tetratricopeptide (TPR) repeat protein